MAEWHPIDFAPKKSGPVDLWAKWWNARTDTFEYRRFPDCRWSEGDSMCNRAAGWDGISQGWRPTHFMLPPPGPDGEATP